MTDSTVQRIQHLSRMTFLEILSVFFIVQMAASANTSFKCPQPHGQFANPADCETFYVCSFGRAMRMNCPEGLSYNPSISVCDWPSNVHCDRHLHQEASSRISNFTCPEPSGHFANPSDCSTFYLCSFNQAFLMTCPASLHYNSQLGICDWSFNVNCSA